MMGSPVSLYLSPQGSQGPPGKARRAQEVCIGMTLSASPPCTQQREKLGCREEQGRSHTHQSMDGGVKQWQPHPATLPLRERLPPQAQGPAERRGPSAHITGGP